MQLNRFRKVLVHVAVIAAVLSSLVTPAGSEALAAEGAGYRIVNSFPHDPDAFTQGLAFFDGCLYESTGLNGRSSVRRVEPETGKVLQRFDLPYRYFGEGLTVWKDRIVQLTWKSRVGIVYDLKTFAKRGEFTYETEGWGIAQDESSLIMSDGTDVLRFLDPETFRETRRVAVRFSGKPVFQLNELEYVGGEILANVWGSDSIARISPRTGEVLGWVDLGGLRLALGPVRNVDVLNGIAYDARRDRLFVTGKLWPRVFEIKLFPVGR
ncbi:MAG: glutaminyl-peptide cyclotransferase [Syntrophobacteraceae bacterium]